ncbi:uncharacterized protein A4U43_C08F22420 [Asparagus officinalis]|nr:uncharacterized protein A4U43_C08F22420 [Asparagus officinalis]
MTEGAAKFHSAPSPQPADKGKQPMVASVISPISQPVPALFLPVVGEGSSPSLVEVTFKGVQIRITKESWELLSLVLSHSAKVAPPHSLSTQIDQVIRISSSDSMDKDSSLKPPPGFEKIKK